MNCALHTDVEATGFCRNCGRALCPSCTREVQGVFYCETCLAGMVSRQPVAAPGAPGAQANAGPNPGLAFILGFVPGLGAVYNGEYNKALIHVVVFITLIVGLSSGAGAGASVALSLTLTAFIIYMAIDAHRVARARLTAGLSGAPAAAPETFNVWGQNMPVGPILLILLGVLFLLDQFGWLSVSRIFDFWPVILIALGVWMLRKRIWRSS
jgi:Domain of unknown function (DUF5668)/B-box zinc finger